MTQVIAFASGSNLAGEIRGFCEIDHDVGVTVTAINAAAWTELGNLIATERRLFVDSGAFAEVSRDNPLEVVAPISDESWQERLLKYRALCLMFPPAKRGRLYLVAPDHVADQEVTLQRLRRYREQVRDLHQLGARLLVALQGGELAPERFFCHIVRALGLPVRDLIPAFPMAKARGDLQCLTNFAYAVRPERLHLLGIGVTAKEWPEVEAAVRTGHPGVELSCDSCRVTAGVNGKLQVDYSRPASPKGYHTKAISEAADELAEGMYAEGPMGDLIGEHPGDWTDSIVEDVNEWMVEAPNDWRVGLNLINQFCLRAELTKAESKEFRADPYAWLQEGDPPRYEWPEVEAALDYCWRVRYWRMTTQERKRRGVKKAFGQAAKVDQHEDRGIRITADLPTAFVAINSEPTKSGRSTVEGYARVKLLDAKDDRVQVKVVKGTVHSKGFKLWLPRHDVYITPDENDYFGRLVTWIHNGNKPPGDRPEAPPLYRGDRLPYNLDRIITLNCGLGRDSIAMLCLVFEEQLEVEGLGKIGPQDLDCVVFSDTGCEWPHTYLLIDRIKHLCERFKIRFVVLEKGTSYHKRASVLEDLQSRATVASLSKGDCTDNHKIQPIRRLLNEISKERWDLTNRQYSTLVRKGKRQPHITMIGIAADEASRIKHSDRAPDYVTEAYPLVTMNIGKPDEDAILKRWGLERTRKSGCFMCPYQPASWYWALSVTQPQLYAKVVEYERIALERNPRMHATGYKRTIPEVVERWREKNPDADVNQVLDKTYTRCLQEARKQQKAQVEMFHAQ